MERDRAIRISRRESCEFESGSARWLASFESRPWLSRCTRIAAISASQMLTACYLLVTKRCQNTFWQRVPARRRVGASLQKSTDVTAGRPRKSAVSQSLQRGTLTRLRRRRRATLLSTTVALILSSLGRGTTILFFTADRSRQTQVIISDAVTVQRIERRTASIAGLKQY